MVEACNALNDWENGSTASTTFNRDPVHVTVENDAKGTPLEAALQAWVTDLNQGATAAYEYDTTKSLLENRSAAGGTHPGCFWA